jgi:hypothetical protein
MPVSGLKVSTPTPAREPLARHALPLAPQIPRLYRRPQILPDLDADAPRAHRHKLRDTQRRASDPQRPL